MEESSKKRPPNFRLEIPGDVEFKATIQRKIHEVKSFLTSKQNKPVNNAVIIEELLDFWLKGHSKDKCDIPKPTFSSTYLQVRKKCQSEIVHLCRIITPEFL
jgi:hypothetical protein